MGEVVEVDRGDREWVVNGGCEEHGGVFDFPKWQH